MDIPVARRMLHHPAFYYICCFLMKRIASFVVLLVVLAFTAQTTVVSFFPELKAYLVTSSGIAEEVLEEDESGEDDKVLIKSLHAFEGMKSPAVHSQQVMGTPVKLFREILAPPPQA
jgi:hypothetical protein